MGTQQRLWLLLCLGLMLNCSQLQALTASYGCVIMSSRAKAPVHVDKQALLHCSQPLEV